MTTPISRLVAALAGVVGLCLSSPVTSQPMSSWFSTWAAPPVEAPAGTDFGGLTTREILHATLAGSEVRLRISNLYGTIPLTIGEAHIAVPTGPATIDASTDTALSFGGNAAVTIPVGAVVVSDAATFTVAANSNYTISLYTPVSTGPATLHLYSSHDSYIAIGNQVSDGTMSDEYVVGTEVIFASGLDVYGTSGQAGIVTIGDSITEGYGSIFSSDTSWPDDLSDLLTAHYGSTRAVANAGIGGNTLLTNTGNEGGLARFDRDVLALPGTVEVIEAEGINDLGEAGTNPFPSAADLIAGLKQMIDRAHEKGLVIYGATITPCGGSYYFNSVFEKKRELVNDFIRSGSAFDGYVDFDRAVRDPTQPTRLMQAFDSGDHIHPNSFGYRAMANMYPLNGKVYRQRH
jgi:lysophospholipase L1-like esterase